eukprot:16427853-Heterocapsa_arctica.AAC.1
MLAPGFATTLGFGTQFRVTRDLDLLVVVVLVVGTLFCLARTAARVVQQLLAGAPEAGLTQADRRRAGHLEARNGYGY